MNKIDINFNKFLAEDSELLNKCILKTKHYHENDHETLFHLIDNHYGNMIRQIELTQELAKLEVTKNEYVAMKKEGVGLEVLAGALSLEVNEKLNKLMRSEIYHYFNEKGILVAVGFEYPNFTLDFTIEDDDYTSGQIINLKLEDILSNMIAYKLTFSDAVISSLTYKTLQAEIPKCGECGTTLSINNDTGLCADCQRRIEADTNDEINQELYEDEQKRIDGIMASKYPKCPDCGAEVNLFPPEHPEFDESKWVHCTKCNWLEKFDEDSD